VLTESHELTTVATSSVRTQRMSLAEWDWRPPPGLADPPPSPWHRRLAAAILLASRGVRVAEMLSRLVEFHGASRKDTASICRVRAPRFAILCYHRVGHGGVPIYSGLPRAVFEAQMNYLRRRYRVVSLGQVLRELTEPSSTEPAVAVTFDDGYVDLYTQAFPILQQYEIPATVFLTVGAIETGEVAWYDRVFVAFQVTSATKFTLPSSPPRTLHLGTPEQRLQAAEEFISLMRELSATERRARCAELEASVAFPRKSLVGRMLTWDDIQRMQAGGVCFGTHTMTHAVVSRLSDEELEWELGESKRILEGRLQRQVADFAFPFGKSRDYSNKAVAYLKRLGYRSGVTTVEDLNRPGANPLVLCRVTLCEERSLAMFALQLARLFLLSGVNHASCDGRPDLSESTNQVS
jgi:peptidoglycan/xylan/chitin deacetylase (PgdA/CDA1 family)